MGNNFLFIYVPTARLRSVFRLRVRARLESRIRRRASPQHDTSAFPYFIADRRARLRTFFATLALALIITGPVAAQRPSETEPQVDDEATRIQVDEQADVIRFIVEGEERAVLDAEGLHINGDIDYSGTITDGNRYSYPSAGEEGAE